MIDDIVYDTTDNTIFETDPVSSGTISGMSFDGDYFDFTVGTINIDYGTEGSRVILN
jgi:hypothetical protein